MATTDAQRERNLERVRIAFRVYWTQPHVGEDLEALCSWASTILSGQDLTDIIGELDELWPFPALPVAAK